MEGRNYAELKVELLESLRMLFHEGTPTNTKHPLEILMVAAELGVSEKSSRVFSQSSSQSDWHGRWIPTCLISVPRRETVRSHPRGLLLLNQLDFSKLETRNFKQAGFLASGSQD